MNPQLLDNPAERRKQVRLKVRPDLQHVEQRYEGKAFYVIKDPVCLRYYRFNRQEYFVFSLFDGTHTMEDVRKKFEDEYKPHRLEFSDLEGFARQLVTAGLVQHEAAGTGKHLFQRRLKQRRMKRFAAISNIMYWKIPVFDPDRLLTYLYRFLWWIFTPAFLAASVGLMLAALLQVVLHYGTFHEKLPAYNEFFQFRTVLYMWLSLGVVKVIHEFGHGLSCKAYGGECHEMGILLMCFSPALFANVTDAWTVADKWKRIIISFAGIYVELVVASLATFVWWYTPHMPMVNYTAMCIMVLCSVSTVMFNANPLMRFDGYYMLADWLEIPNLRDRANKFLNNLFLSKCLGIEVPPEQYMSPRRKWLFVVYAIASYIYRWVLTFSIVWFLSDFLNPKLKVLSRMLAMLSLFSMFLFPTYKVFKNIRQRGRMPDVKPRRVYLTLGCFAAFVAAFVLLPLPISRVRETGLTAPNPEFARPIGVEEPAVLTGVVVTEGQPVRKGQVVARMDNRELADDLNEWTGKWQAEQARGQQLRHEAGRTNSVPLEGAAAEADSAADQYRRGVETRREQLDTQRTLRAPIDGVAMGVPRLTDEGRTYDQSGTKDRPLMSIADPSKLIVKIPISSADYKHLKEERGPTGKELDVTVYVTGRTDRNYHGKLRRLPDSAEKTVPVALTHRAGGPLSVTQNPETGEVVPVAQTYLVEVELTDPDSSIRPGALVTAKIHCRWRSAGWWVWRKASEALDIGLY